MELKPKTACQCEGKELPLLISPTFNQRHRRNLANNTVAGTGDEGRGTRDGQNRPRLLGVKSRYHVRKMGKTGLNQPLTDIKAFLHSHPILFAPLPLSGPPKYFVGRKNT